MTARLKTIALLAGAAGLLAGLVVLRTVDPGASPIFPRCLFLQFTSLYCPGCGVQRALHALLHGRVLEALASNAMAVAAVPTVLLGGLARFGPGVLRERLRWRPPAAAYWTVVLATISFWLLRNVSTGPFALLAP